MKTQVFKIRLDDLFLREDQSNLDVFLEKYDILKTDSAFVASDNLWTVLVFYEQSVKNPPARINKAEKYCILDEELNPDENKVFESLMVWRSEQAKVEKLPSYFIASNNELKSVAKMKPQTEEELLQIKGFGRFKVENYAESIIKIVNYL